MVQIDPRATADSLLRERRFVEAIDQFELHLAQHPDDLTALLRQGICHLLAGSEQAFLAIRERAITLLAGSKQLPDEVTALWETYERLFKKITATALVLGPLTACGGTTTAPADGSTTSTTPQPTIAAPVEKPASMHRYSGGVALELIPEPPAPAVPAADDQDSAEEALFEEEEAKPASMHRYSGGVYKRPVPEAPRKK